MTSLIVNDALWAFWFFLPAGIANMTPPIANKIPGLNHWNMPMDFGKSYRGRRIFGDNKRWRGLVFGTIMGGLTSALEFAYLTRVGTSYLILEFVILGMVLGFGALAGDAVASFFKRQVGVKSGHVWFPFDQIDYIVGGLVFSYPFVRYTVQEILLIFVVYFGLHLVMSYIGYLLKLKDRPI